jgi:hypothetical protein
MPKSRNKRKNKKRNIAIKTQAMNIANKKIRESRDTSHPAFIGTPDMIMDKYTFDSKTTIFDVINRLQRKYT